MNYSYLADGSKLSATDGEGDGLLYRGSLIYRKTGDDIELESAAFSEGRFVRSAGGIIRPMTHITDHLDSVRAVVDGLTGQTAETNDYYPFGSRWEDEDGISDPTNRYRFNGKEDQEGEFGVPTLDYGARHYTPSSARWLSMDPLAEKYYGVSPYAFCNNDPVNFVDPDGERLYFAKDVSDKFKKQFAETIKFMNSKGTSGDIARLHSSETIYYIGEASRGKEHWNHFNLHTRTILWDPNTIYESPENMFVSPATTLAHEVSHALRYDTAMNSDDPDIKANYIRALQSDSANKYRSQEEEIVITTTEQSAARKHGEIRKDQVTRKGHTSGKLISIGSDMSPEDLSKSIFEHNNLF